MSTITLQDITCLISLMPMTDPVTDDDGTNYDRASIEAWLRTNPERISPITRNRITHLTPNRLLKEQIERYTTAMNAATTDAFIARIFKNCQVTVNKTWQNGLLHVQVVPPETGPRQGIVLGMGIDNSGSMSNLACDVSETGGKAFTRLDLTKHTLRAIIGMLGPEDMLYIVKFSDRASVVMLPTAMTEDGKAKANIAVKTITPDGSTNIWDCLKMLNFYANKFPGRNVVTALLTDGVANIRPPRGEIESLKMLERSECVSSFGFGNQIDSKLLSDIATVGEGSLAIATDFSMVGTVFINWCAALLATASKNLTIDLGTTILNTGLIQYGQSRDFLVSMAQKPEDAEEGVIDEFVIARNELMDALKICAGKETVTGGRNIFTTLYEKYQHTTHPKVKELIKDIKPPGEDDEGQVHMSHNPKYWDTWGRHYLRSYLKAQQNQTCMNFKDPGLQIYGGAPFHDHQEMGDKIFCDLPPLEPTGQSYSTSGYGYGSASASASASTISAAPLNMGAIFHDPSGGCFAPECEVLMADGTRKTIKSIKKDDLVWTPDGPASVLLHITIGSYNRAQPMCRIGKLLITPWHPILLDNRWIFPDDVVALEDRIMPTIYNLVLSKGHIINVEGTLTVTLGHEFTANGVKHEFFGSKVRILEALSKQPGFKEGYPVYKNLKPIRDPVTTMIIDWIDKV